MKRILLGILSVVFLSIVSVNIIYASDVGSVDYDISVGGTQRFEKVDSSGYKEDIIISEDNNRLDSLANKVYTISKKGNGWHVSYKVKINRNKIASVYGLSAVATVGSFKSSSLRKVSNTSVKWSGIHRVGFINNNVFCNAVISGGSLHIS